MLHVTYEIWGVGVSVLLIGIWTIRGVIRLKNAKDAGGVTQEEFNPSLRDHDIDHRALMFLMTQKTDSVLAALADTIQKERQKLGVVVRNPSMAQAIDAFQTEAIPVSGNRQSPYDQILPMASKRIAVPKIARQLNLPEAEVSMVIRLNAA